MSPKPLTLLLAVLLVPLPLSGCHVTIGNPSTTSSPSAAGAVPKSALEQITAQNVRDQLKGGPIVITCPHDLPIKLGATEECVMAQDSKKYPITLKIKKVNGPDDATWDFEVGHELSSS